MNKVWRSGSGKSRKSWRIRESLDERGLTMSDVARALEVDYSVVRRTVAGIDNNRRVLIHLKSLGIPINVLSLPDDLQDTGSGVPFHS